MKKPSFLTDGDIEALKNARKVFKKITRHIKKLNETRTWCDMNKDKDAGGRKWVKATTELYDVLDFTDKMGISDNCK